MSQSPESLRDLLDRVRASDRYQRYLDWHLPRPGHPNTHDTFKPEQPSRVPIRHPKHHASLASAFLAELGADEDLQAMAQFHDEPYALWHQVQRKGRYSSPRFERFAAAIRDWHTFCIFTIVDKVTDGKESTTSLEWWLTELLPQVSSEVAPTWGLQCLAALQQRRRDERT